MRRRVNFLGRDTGSSKRAPDVVAPQGTPLFRHDEQVTLTERDIAPLQAFYLSLLPTQRRVHFRAAMTDEGILRHCAGIDWPGTMLVASGNAGGITALVEVHAASDLWDRAELRLACRAQAGLRQVMARLVRLAVASAEQRGCHQFAIRLDAVSWDILPLLAGMAPHLLGEELALELLLEVAAGGAGRQSAEAALAR